VLFGLGIAVEILFVRHEQKDWNGKPGPLGKPQIFFFTILFFSKRTIQKKFIMMKEIFYTRKFIF